MGLMDLSTWISIAQNSTLDTPSYLYTLASTPRGHLSILINCLISLFCAGLGSFLIKLTQKIPSKRFWGKKTRIVIKKLHFYRLFFFALAFFFIHTPLTTTIISFSLSHNSWINFPRHSMYYFISYFLLFFEWIKYISFSSLSQLTA